MAFADASETRVAYIAESTFGTTPSTPAWQVMRVTSDGGLKGEQQTVRSNELRSDAEVADEVKVGESATGDLPFELSFGSDFDTLMEHACRSAFATNAAATAATALDVATASTITRASGSFLTDGWEFGMLFTATGFANGANNSTFTLREVSALTLTTQEGGLTTETGSGDEALDAPASSESMAAGVLKKSLSIEKTHEIGGSDAYFRYVGCRVGGMNLTVSAQNLVSGSFPILGLSESTDTAIVSGATYTAANTSSVMSSCDNAATAFRGDAGPFYYTNLSLSLTNNLRAQNAIGSVGAVGIGYGRREITGTITAFFENLSQYDEAVNNNTGGLSFRCTDGTNWYNFVLPRVRFTSRDALAGGNNQDIVCNLNFTATYDSTVGASIRIDKSS